MRLSAITDAILEEAVRAQQSDDFDTHDIIFWISRNRPRPYVQDLYLALQDEGDPFVSLHSAIGKRLAALPDLVQQQHEKRTSPNVRGERTECELWQRVGSGDTGAGLSPRLRRVRDMLVSAAKERSVVHYRQVAEALGIESDRLDHSAQLAHALDEISTFEHEHGRPLLSVVVVHQDDKRPGGGFYKMAKRNGVQEPDEDNETFFVAELGRAHDYWAGQGM